jgi:hypothetical protein
MTHINTSINVDMCKAKSGREREYVRAESFAGLRAADALDQRDLPPCRPEAPPALRE